MPLGSDSRRSRRERVGACVAFFACAAAASAGDPAVGPSAATLGLLSATAGVEDDGVGPTLAWILAGSALGGAIAWIGADAAAVGLSTRVAGGLGAAVGGGLGGASSLLRVDETEPDGDEEVTVSAADSGADAPAVDDLFESHVDPVLYYSGEDGQLFVRAVNPAFEERFGASAPTLSETPLAGALGTDDAGEIVERLADGDAVDRTVACETVDGPATYRIRSVHLPGDRPQGYLQFTRPKE